MKILDDSPGDAGAHAFAVELETGDEPDGAQVRELWASAADKGEYGVPACDRAVRGRQGRRGGRAGALQRFNEAPDNGWRWTVDALASHLLHERCGIVVLDCRRPVSSGAADAASPPGGRKR